MVTTLFMTKMASQFTLLLKELESFEYAKERLEFPQQIWSTKFLKENFKAGWKINLLRNRTSTFSLFQIFFDLLRN